MAAKKDSNKGVEEQVQAAVDEETEQGFRGTKVDPTPNENYSLETSPDAPTPESDPESAAKAREVLSQGDGQR